MNNEGRDHPPCKEDEEEEEEREALRASTTTISELLLRRRKQGISPIEQGNANHPPSLYLGSSGEASGGRGKEESIGGNKEEEEWQPP